MEKEAVIEVKDLVAGYDDEIILENLNLSVFEGEILVILGGSGCGKSTLLRHVVGLSEPISGSIIIDGVDITSCSDAQYNSFLRKIGVLFQSSALFGSMTLAENIALSIQEYTDFSKSSVENLVSMKLCMVDLQGYENHLPSELSGGMKKRAGLARALALNPKFLFLDEPTAGLDPITSAEIDELILRINQTNGATVMIVTHELESIFKVARRVIMLDKKKKGIVAEGDPVFLKENSRDPLVKQFFNRMAKPRSGTGVTEWPP
jgi:phospholipid/cholesterol/gamma-HCH transport system ATP-binding protein